MMPRSRAAALALLVTVAGLSPAFAKDACWPGVREIDPTPRWVEDVIKGPCAPVAAEKRSQKKQPEAHRCWSDRPEAYRVVEDLHGPRQLLLLAAQPITGIEDPRAWAADADNLWKDATDAGEAGLALTFLGRPMFSLGLAVNARDCRSVDRLHIHIDRTKPTVIYTLEDAGVSADQWKQVTFTFDQQPETYWVRIVPAAMVLKRNPLAEAVPMLPKSAETDSDTRGRYSFAVVAHAVPHRVTYYLLLGQKSLGSGHAEDLLEIEQ